MPTAHLYMPMHAACKCTHALTFGTVCTGRNIQRACLMQSTLPEQAMTALDDDATLTQLCTAWVDLFLVRSPVAHSPNAPL